MKGMWEILIPTVRNDGKAFRTHFHKVWDEKVRLISGGLTVMPVAKGQWIFKETDGNNKLFEERMIPVRVIATREEIEQIISMTMAYYGQIAVLAYKISEEVILRHKDGRHDI